MYFRKHIYFQTPIFQDVSADTFSKHGSACFWGFCITKTWPSNLPLSALEDQVSLFSKHLEVVWLTATTCHRHGARATNCGEQKLRHTRHRKVHAKKYGRGVEWTEQLAVGCGCQRGGVAKWRLEPNSPLYMLSGICKCITVKLPTKMIMSS